MINRRDYYELWDCIIYQRIIHYFVMIILSIDWLLINLAIDPEQAN